MIKEHDSFFLQSIASISLLVELDKIQYMDSEHFNNLKFDNPSFKAILKESSLGNPATLQIFLYTLLVVPRELNKNLSLNLKFNRINKMLKKFAIEPISTYENEVDFDMVNVVRNCVAHSSINYTKDNEITFATFVDMDPSNSEKYRKFKIKTGDLGIILTEIQKIILNHININ